MRPASVRPPRNARSTRPALRKQDLPLNESMQSIEARRSELHIERQSVIDAGKQAIAALDAQETREQQRLIRLDQQIRARVEQARTRCGMLENNVQALLSVLATADFVAQDRRRNC